MSTIFRTWTIALNVVPATNATLQGQASSVLRARKNNYVNAGWTVQSSSDGVTQSNTDLWVSDAALVWAAAGVAHSHCVLRSQTLGGGRFIYLLLACSTGATNQHLVNETMSSAVFTGGTTTADPTTTALMFRTNNNKQFLRTPVAASHYHAMYNTVGDAVFFTSPDAAGYPAHASGYITPANGESGINYPCWGFSRWQDSAPGGFVVANGSMGTAANSWMWLQDGIVAQNQSGAWTYAVTSGQEFMSNFNGNQGSIGALATWLLMPMPIGAVGTPTGGSLTAGFYGTAVDISLAPNGTNTPQADGEPNIGTLTTAKFGEGMFPCGGTSPVF